jgi:formylglycine-generating enzyme required for sulfatase activity
MADLETYRRDLRRLVDATLWISIPAGSLQRGTPATDIDAVVRGHSDLGLPRSYFAKEAPRHAVRVETFALAATPVTAEMWSAFAHDAGLQAPIAPPGHPIDGVAWERARDFCAWLSDRLDEIFRLPSEDEWERAARGDDAREYPWGDTFDASRANLAEAGRGGTTPVGTFPSGASPFGVLDLAGNVDEWTATVYAPYPGAPSDVPATEDWAVDPHVTRGGSWRQHRDLARCARRHGVYPGNDGAGFRLARG